MPSCFVFAVLFAVKYRTYQTYLQIPLPVPVRRWLKFKPKLIYFIKVLPFFFNMVKQSKNWEVIVQAFFSFFLFSTLLYETLKRFQVLKFFSIRTLTWFNTCFLLRRFVFRIKAILKSKWLVTKPKTYRNENQERRISQSRLPLRAKWHHDHERDVWEWGRFN